MVHAVKMLYCKNGHLLPISFEGNECGCHHDGKPCLVISCRKCFEERMKGKDIEDMGMINIPLEKEAIEELNKLLKEQISQAKQGKNENGK